MNIDEKIYVAGHTGLVGQALVRALKNQGFKHILQQTHHQLDLTQSEAVQGFFAENQPDYVFLAAAKVGGIWANDNYPADFIWQNLQIQNNVLAQAKAHGVKRLLFLGSSCIYPRECPQPIKEEYLLTGPLESTNRPYAIAKIAGIELCWSFNRQFGTQFLAVMPTNLYGPGDNYDLQQSHVIPALIRKMHEAKESNQRQVIVWGTGKPRREFLHSDDLAQACVYLMNLPEDKFQQLILSPTTAPIINIGWGQDIPIADLAKLIANVTEFTGDIIFDASKPDGTPRKMLSIEKIMQLGWHAHLSLEQGLHNTYHHFKNEHHR